MPPIRTKLFGEAAFLLQLIDDLLPVALTHNYTFVEDDSFKEWTKSPDFTIERMSYIITMELIDKAHLAATTSLIRTKRWADAACLMCESSNFLGWASSARGLIESAGDIVDGLLNIAPTMAKHHQAISRCLTGMPGQVYTFSDTEAALDHFVLAKWARKNGILAAKANADYVRILETVIPGAVKIYQKLCSITHPSSDSISYLFDQDIGNNGKLRLSPKGDAKAIAGFCVEFPKALPDAVMMSCNPPLLILRVLHKFGIHPKLAKLKKLDWHAIKMWPDIEQDLSRSYQA